MASNEPLFIYTWNDVRVSTNYTLFAPKTNGDWQTTRYLHSTRMTHENPFIILKVMAYYLFYIIFIPYNYQIIQKSYY